MGIGIGALIFHPFNSNSLGGGIWFGKKRRKRNIKNKHMESVNNNDNQGWSTDEASDLILKWIDDAKELYDEK